MKEIYEGRLGALETLFSCGVCVFMCMVHVHKRLYGRSTAYNTIKKLNSQLTAARGEGQIRTESEETFIRHVGCAADKISRVTFGHLIVTYVVTFHPSALELIKHTRDLLRAGGGLQLEREEDLRTAGGIVPVYELRHLARVYNRVKSKKAGEWKTSCQGSKENAVTRGKCVAAPSWAFRYVHA